jgi:hypothetical protein
VAQISLNVKRRGIYSHRGKNTAGGRNSCRIENRISFAALQIGVLSLHIFSPLRNYNQMYYKLTWYFYDRTHFATGE